MLKTIVGVSAVEMLLAVNIWVAVLGGKGFVTAADQWFYIDAFSAFHIAVLSLVFLLSSAFASVYFAQEASGHVFTATMARRFGVLWLGAQAAMLLVLVSNNLGIMWVGMEATTLLTAFLISLHPSQLSLEAMWKYLIICSIGIAFAFMGTLLAAAAVQSDGGAAADALFWTKLASADVHLNPTLMKFAFVFVLVGYGTKAGLAPMHSWLPDAHSQAPAPVSAMFSGFLLNTALYCIMRFVPPVQHALGQDFASGLLIVFGTFSILVAAGFIVFQRDAKRLLAYHSVEHMGIITLGYALGPIGSFAALFHTLNHSVCKSLAFFAVGRLGQRYGSHDMEHDLWRTAGRPAVGSVASGQPLGADRCRPVLDLHERISVVAGRDRRRRLGDAHPVSRRQRRRFSVGAAASDRHGFRDCGPPRSRRPRWQTGRPDRGVGGGASVAAGSVDAAAAI